MPPISDNWMYLVNIISDQKDFRLQIIADSSSKWFREYWGSWKPWNRIDNFGCSTPNDLASLLGGEGLMPKSDTIETIDCNNVTTTGWKRLSNSSTNAPTGISHGARLLHFVHDNGYNMQLILNRTGDLYTRVQNSGTWSSWQQVYDTSLLTNSTLLSPLATALGGLRYIGDVVVPTNLDGILTQGLYYGNPADTIFSNKEPACVCVININGKVIQYVTGRDSGKTISRSYNGSSWSSWQRLDAFGCATESELASLLGGELKYKKKQFVRAGNSKIYARIYFTNSGSTSSSANILCTVQPMNSDSVYTSIIYAYKFNQTNVSGLSVKKIISYGGNSTAVYFKEQYVYVECPSWNTMALEVLNSDTTGIVIDTVDSLPSGCSEASEIQ